MPTAAWPRPGTRSTPFGGFPSRTPRSSSPTRATASSSPPSPVGPLARVDEVDELTQARVPAPVEGKHQTREAGKLTALGGKRSRRLLDRTLQDVGEAKRDLRHRRRVQRPAQAHDQALPDVPVRVEDPIEPLDL